MSASDILSIISIIVGICAIITAIVVYSKTAELQRKTINYSMLNDRIHVWKYMEHDRHQPEALIARIMEGRDWELEKFRLLFSKKLVQEYDNLIRFGEESGNIDLKIDGIERDEIPIHKEGECVNQSDMELFAKVQYKRKEIINTGLRASPSELAEYKAFCQQTFRADKWQEYHSYVLKLMERNNEHKKMLESFLENLHKEVSATVIEEQNE